MREDDTCFNEHAQRSEKLSPQVKPIDLQYQLVLMKASCFDESTSAKYTGRAQMKCSQDTRHKDVMKWHTSHKEHGFKN